jgi:hypothetical protein
VREKVQRQRIHVGGGATAGVVGAHLAGAAAVEIRSRRLSTGCGGASAARSVAVAWGA